MSALAWWRHLLVCAWYRCHRSANSARNEAELARLLVRDADTRMKLRIVQECERARARLGPVDAPLAKD